MLAGKRLSKVSCPPQPSPGVSFAPAWAQPGGCSLQGSNGSLPRPQGGVSTDLLVRVIGGPHTQPSPVLADYNQSCISGAAFLPTALGAETLSSQLYIPAFFQISIQLLCTTAQTLEAPAPALSPRLLKDHSRPKAAGESNDPCSHTV